jgi:hypothetical protein
MPELAAGRNQTKGARLNILPTFVAQFSVNDSEMLKPHVAEMDFEHPFTRMR